MWVRNEGLVTDSDDLVTDSYTDSPDIDSPIATGYPKESPRNSENGDNKQLAWEVVLDDPPTTEPKKKTNYWQYLIPAAAFIPPLGILFAANECYKAYKDDTRIKVWSGKSDWTRRLAIIAPTVLTSGAAFYCTMTYVSLLTGLVLPPWGMALAIVAAVSITATFVTLITKLLTELVTLKPIKSSEQPEGSVLRQEEPAKQVNYNLEIIKQSRFAPFWNKTILSAKRNILDNTYIGKSDLSNEDPPKPE